MLLSPPQELLQEASDLEKVPLDSILDIVVSYLSLVTEHYKLVDSHNALVNWFKIMESKHGNSDGSTIGAE